MAEQLAGRAATPSTRRQDAAIYRSLGDWLGSELGRQRQAVLDRLAERLDALDPSPNLRK